MRFDGGNFKSEPGSSRERKSHRAMSRAEQNAAMEQVSKAIVDAMMSVDRVLAFYALNVAIGVLWSNGSSLTTVTEAVDKWRCFSAEIEKNIRASFGSMRYPEGE